MKLGIMGGTFDPPHLAHLVIAETARDELQLDSIIFIPAGDPWMKSAHTVTPADERVEMVRLAIDSNAGFSLSVNEVNRPGPTYTVDTIEQIAGEMRQSPEIFLLLGWDSLAELPSWKAPYRLSKMVRFVAFPRPQAARPDPAELEKAMPGSAEKIIYMDGPYLNISSTCIRQRVKDGRSVRYLVPEAVGQYILEHKLYTA
jgi:nicotinate-nucleotide adenylyltransferase